MLRIKRTVSLILCVVLVISSLAGCNLSASKVPATDIVKDIIENEINAENNENNAQKQESIASKVDVEDEAEVNFETNFVSGTTNTSDKENDDVKENVTEDLIVSLVDKELSNDKTPEDIVDENGDLKVPFDIAYPDIFNSDEVEYADNALLIKVKNTYSEKTVAGLKEAGIGKMETMFEVENATWYTAYLLKGVKVNDAMEKVRQVSGIITAEYNFKYETALAEGESAAEAEVVENPQYAQQWAKDKFGILKAWYEYLKKLLNGGDETPTGGGSSNVIVAVIDTGVDYTHEDLKGNMWKNINEIPDNGIDDDSNGYIDDYYGVDMTNTGYDAENRSGMDDNGHGTHVAGIIAAQNNDKGMVGYAYNTKIMNIKAGDATGYFMQSNVANAIIYAYNHGADVINMSFGGAASSIAVQDALAVAYSRCVLVASAGNDGSPNEYINKNLPAPNYPAAFSYVLGVMSVGQNNVESSFTNWDAYSFNSVEYEVYAPGEQMISTLPGNRYGKLSGTSMAAPVVAAQAALLRSYFNDTDVYSTKFIYGQIVGTTDKIVECLDPKAHGEHNIPGVINFYESIVRIPVPEVSMTDYTIFDTEEYIADTEGLTNIEKTNNGDGVIDAGEVLALGLTLRNRWGMSEDTIVHIDVVGPGGVANPYVTILNNDINYKSIGTYSENDCGKLYTDDGEMFNGWKNPFYIQIAKNCPNDYSVKINITITSKNALDKNDTTVYTTQDEILFTVRRGQILPNKVTEDMTLTKDNYYIIPNSMMIMEGATVTVEAGTKIQFWCSDPTDSYADTAITYLSVAGKFICEGTEEEPVELFPSGWMDNYRVEIKPYRSGYISLTYTNVVNPYIDVNEAINCTFTQNYKSYLYYRELWNGEVNTVSSSARINAAYAKNSAFYKIGGGEGNYAYVYGKYDGCIFVDSAIEFDQIDAAENCVFYGNNTYWDSQYDGATSSMTLQQEYSEFSIKDIYRNNETGTTYIIVYTGNSNYSYSMHDRFAKIMGGEILSFDNQDELIYVAKTIRNNLSDEDINYWYNLGLCKIDDVFYNYNGTSFDVNSSIIHDLDGSLAYITYYGQVYKNDEEIPNYANKISFPYTKDRATRALEQCYNYMIYEIPGEIYITDIYLDEYLVNMDMEETHQINATLIPKTADKESLVYESQDESVVIVDENGKVTPVGEGSTTVRVYAPDYAIYNYVTFNVVETVELESLSFANGEEITVNVNEPLKLKLVYNPTYTTKKAVTFTSSNESVVSVNEKGYITGLKEGQATITVTGYNDITASIIVNVIVPTATIAFEEEVYVVPLGDSEINFYPVITPADATNQDLVWESSNPDVCYIDKYGVVRGLREGTAVLRATVKGTSLSDTVTIAVTDKLIEADIVKIDYEGNYEHMFALLSDGTVWVWGNSVTIPKLLPVEKAKDIMCYARYIYVLNYNGEVIEYSYYNDNFDTYYSSKVLDNIASLGHLESNYNQCFAVANDGSVWAWGYNYNGQLGVGSYGDINPPAPVMIDDTVTKVVTVDNRTGFLTDTGKVYMAGSDYGETPILVLDNATDIYAYDKNYAYSDYLIAKTETGFVKLQNPNDSLSLHSDDDYLYEGNGISIIDGIVYSCSGSSYNSHESKAIEGLENVVQVHYIYGRYYFETEDGKIYVMGSGDKYLLGTGNTEVAKKPTRIFFGLTENIEEIELQNWKEIEAGFMIPATDDLVLDFNQALVSQNNYIYITLKDSNGYNIAITKTIDLDKLIINPRTNLTPGEVYTLTIPANAFTDSSRNNTNDEIILTFTCIEAVEDDTVLPEEIPDTLPEEGGEEESIINDAVIDEELMSQRHFWTYSEVWSYWNQFVSDGLNTRFYANAFLNRLHDDSMKGWLRIEGANDSGQTLGTISFGGNYWGTTNIDLINKQILDFDDYQTLLDINEGAFLTEAPEDTFPFVVDAYLEVNGELVETVGKDLVTFTVKFNRDMDTSIPLEVKWGSSYPYAEYTVVGAYVDEDEDGASRIWQGQMQLSTIIENGYQYFSVSNGKAAGTSLELYTDWGRFPFKIDTTAAQSLTMQAEVTNTGIKLMWEQDSFETLAGYNVYRSTEEDGYYTKLNKTVIPADVKEWFDDEVMPGQRYYYNFTVVESDMTESEPSGKVRATAMDTMAPDIYHTPVYHAFTGNNLVITAEVTDNVSISSATLYYRTTATEAWTSKRMSNFNDKYSAVISANDITVAGIEYYIVATDGVSETYKGSAENPYSIAVQLAVSDSEKGDVDGNGTIELRDALMVLMAINDRLNLTEEQFARANLNNDQELTADEALRILQYANGMISSVLP